MTETKAGYQCPRETRGVNWVCPSRMCPDECPHKPERMKPGDRPVTETCNGCLHRVRDRFVSDDGRNMAWIRCAAQRLITMEYCGSPDTPTDRPSWCPGFEFVAKADNEIGNQIAAEYPYIYAAFRRLEEHAVERAVAHAVAEERERCAKIVAAMMAQNWTREEHRDRILAAIRNPAPGA